MKVFPVPAAVCLALVVFATMVPQAAEAYRFDFFVYENADGAVVDGLDIWVDVIDDGSYVSFVFNNDSSIPSNVSAIYFESAGVGTGLDAGTITGESAGVDFEVGNVFAPSNPAPGQGGDALNWAGTAAMFAAAPPPAQNGIGHIGDEWLSLRFTLDEVTYDDVLAGLEDGSFRIAQHVTGLDPDNLLSVWTRTGDGEEPVPLPAAVWLYGSGLFGMLGQHLVRRRRRA